MVSEARKQLMAWLETDYFERYTRSIKELEHLGALRVMGETAL